MPKIIGRLEQAKHHPGVAVLWDHQSDQPLEQFPIASVEGLLGKRTKAYWIIEMRAGTWHFGRELPAEEAEQHDVVILGQQVVTRAERMRLVGKDS